MEMTHKRLSAKSSQRQRLKFYLDKEQLRQGLIDSKLKADMANSFLKE